MAFTNAIGSAIDIRAIAEEYYHRADAGRADTFDLFTDDVEFYFPKFGVGMGKAAFGEFIGGMLSVIQEIAHDISGFRYVVSANVVVVEGTTSGRDHAGNRWAGGKTSGGRFCSIFEFEGALIKRMYIYLDPDYCGQDSNRFLWGAERRW
jgi:SnoaL-like domain